MKFMSRIVERNETGMEKIVNTEEKLCQKWMFRNLQVGWSILSIRYWNTRYPVRKKKGHRTELQENRAVQCTRVVLLVLGWPFVPK